MMKKRDYEKYPIVRMDEENNTYVRACRARRNIVHLMVFNSKSDELITELQVTRAVFNRSFAVKSSTLPKAPFSVTFWSYFL